MKLLVLALFAAAPAAGAPLTRDVSVSGAYLADKAGLAELRAGAAAGSLGVELWAWRLSDRAFAHPLDAFHGSFSITASSRAEGYVLSGIVGVSYTRASSAGSSYTGPPAPEVGGRFLWDVQPGWRMGLEGRLCMFDDGYGFVGGIAVHKELTRDLWPFLGWRIFWTTQEGADDIVKNGVVLGIAF